MMTRKSLNTLGLGLLVCLICYYNASRLRLARDLSYAIHAISESYVDPVSEVDLKDAAMIGMLESLDRYSGYIPPRSFGRFNALFEQRFAGIGVRIQDSNTEISTGTDGGQPSGVRVIATLFNSPAFRAGILPGDEIIEVNRQDVRNCKLADLSPMLMGAVGTSVQLAIDRGGARFDFEIIREEVEVESITGDRRNRDGTWEYLLQADPRIAYIHADLFGERTSKEIERVCSKLKSTVQGLILDLRDNGGGLLQSAVDICDLFLDDGPIVSTLGRGNQELDFTQAKPGTVVSNSVPIVVLINENSASASEIVAACLKDRHRAMTVGVRSFGKGSVQTVVPVEGGRAAIRFTTAYYFPPSGRRIHRRTKDTDSDEWGVLPEPAGECAMTEDEKSVAVERMKRRSDPLRNGSLADHPAAKTEDPDDKDIEKDLQLWRAIELLRAKIGKL